MGLPLGGERFAGRALTAVERLSKHRAKCANARRALACRYFAPGLQREFRQRFATVAGQDRDGAAQLREITCRQSVTYAGRGIAAAARAMASGLGITSNRASRRGATVAGAMACRHLLNHTLKIGHVILPACRSGTDGKKGTRHRRSQRKDRARDRSPALRPAATAGRRRAGTAFAEGFRRRCCAAMADFIGGQACAIKFDSGARFTRARSCDRRMRPEPQGAPGSC